jgi:hypothetical protein
MLWCFLTVQVSIPDTEWRRTLPIPASRKTIAEPTISSKCSSQTSSSRNNEYYDLKGKLVRAKTDGVKAWMDPEGYRRFIAGKKRAFEDEADEELGVPTSSAK